MAMLVNSYMFSPAFTNFTMRVNLVGLSCIHSVPFPYQWVDYEFGGSDSFGC